MMAVKSDAQPGVEPLLDAWNDRSSAHGFDRWVLRVADAFHESEPTLEAASRLLSVSPAEIEAVLHLAVMNEADLALLKDHVPPKTTWYLFASATTVGIEAAQRALLRNEANRPSVDVVREAIREIEGASESEKVSALPADVFRHMSKKAKQYGQLTDKQQKALASFGSWKKGGKPLTPRQAAWAQSLLATLVNGGVIRRQSPDDDQELCDLVLDALGK
jgi:hypothetical protein